MATEFSCRACGCTMRSTKQLQPDSMVRCPKCGLVFRLDGGKAAETPKPAPAKPVVTAKNSAAIVSRSNERPAVSRRPPSDSDREYADGGLPRRTYRRRSRSGAGTGLLIGMVLGGLALVTLLIGGVILVITLTYKDKSSTVAANDSAPDTSGTVSQSGSYQSETQVTYPANQGNSGINQIPNQPSPPGASSGPTPNQPSLPNGGYGPAPNQPSTPGGSYGPSPNQPSPPTGGYGPSPNQPSIPNGPNGGFNPGSGGSYGPTPPYKPSGGGPGYAPPGNGPGYTPPGNGPGFTPGGGPGFTPGGGPGFTPGGGPGFTPGGGPGFTPGGGPGYTPGRGPGGGSGFGPAGGGPGFPPGGGPGSPVGPNMGGPGVFGPNGGGRGPGVVGPGNSGRPRGGIGDDDDGSEPVILPPTDSKTLEMKPLINPSPPAKAAGDAPPAAANGVLPREILNKVKKATAYIRVPDDKGVAMGSGFFAAGANNMVLTNAHVVGMLQPDSPAPKTIEVILNSGESDEAVFKGEVLALDRHSDLAVLKITPTAKSKDAKLPEPLAIACGASLQETQQVFIFGFPKGELIGKNITIAQSSISSLRKTPEGDLDQIQVNGGMHHGNSGGPVVDAAGNIIGVAVAGIDGTMINFAIPAERVSSILNGRLSSIYMGEPAKKSDRTVIAIEIEALDPLNRLKDLKVDWWWSAENDKAPAAWGSTPAHPADATPRQSVTMTRTGNNRFKGEISFTGAIPAKKVMWMQPNYANLVSANLYTQGVSMEVEPPPQFASANLFFRPKLGRFKLKLEGHNEFNFRVKGDDDKMLNMTQNVEAEMTEEVVGQANDGAVAVKADFSGPGNKITANMLLDGKSAPGASEYAKAVDAVRMTVIDLGLDLQGNVVRGKVGGLNSIPKGSRDDSLQLAKLLDRIMNLGSIPMPNAQGVRPGQSWRARRRVPLATPDEDLSASTTVTYTYRGIRKIEKKSYAVVTLSMRLNTRGKELGISGLVNGKALIDLTTGRAVKVSATVDATMGIRVELKSGRRETVVARSKLDLKLSRQ